MVTPEIIHLCKNVFHCLMQAERESEQHKFERWEFQALDSIILLAKHSEEIRFAPYIPSPKRNEVWLHVGYALLFPFKTWDTLPSSPARSMIPNDLVEQYGLSESWHELMPRERLRLWHYSYRELMATVWRQVGASGPTVDYQFGLVS